MDPTDLRAGLAERLAGSESIDAQTINAACFMLSRAVEELAMSAPDAAPLARRCQLSERGVSGYSAGCAAGCGYGLTKKTIVS